MCFVYTLGDILAVVVGIPAALFVTYLVYKDSKRKKP